MKFLGWKSSVGTFIARITCGLIVANGIWLKRIIQAIDGGNRDIKHSSEIRKLQRFLSEFQIDYHRFSSMIYTMLNIKGKLTFALDRTNWDFGKKHINIFVITVLYRTADDKNFAIPIVWEVFNKKGISNTQERKVLMQRLFEVVGKENIECILGDREFIGDEWFQFLAKNKIPFVLRMKNNIYVEFDGKRIKIDTLVGAVVYQEKIQFNVMINGIPVQLVATRSKEGNLVVVASMEINAPLNEYRLRWFIELFFKSAKSQGFRLEDTHITDPAKIKKLFALIALSILYAVQAGVIRHHHIKKIPVKNHGRALYSLFTYGLDFIRALLSGEFFPISLNIFDLGLLEQYEFRDVSPRREILNFALTKG